MRLSPMEQQWSLKRCLELLQVSGTIVNAGTGKAWRGQRKRADKFASDILIPMAAWKKFIAGDFRKKSVVIKFADDIGVSPAIVVGRLQHEKLLPYSHMNDLRRRFELVTNCDR